MPVLPLPLQKSPWGGNLRNITHANNAPLAIEWIDLADHLEVTKCTSSPRINPITPGQQYGKICLDIPGACALSQTVGQHQLNPFSSFTLHPRVQLRSSLLRLLRIIR